MSIFKKAIKYSSSSQDLNNKIKILDEELKKTGVTVNESDVVSFYENEKTINEIEKFDWRKDFFEEDLEDDGDQLLNEEILAIKETIADKKNKSLKRVDNHIHSINENFIQLKKEIFNEISESFLFNIPKIEEKLNIVLEIYDQVKEGLLREPPEVKNKDPLTPLNQNFVTVEELNKHYSLFINRIQEQVATIGGGGETQLKYLDDIVGIATDPSAYDGKFLKYNHSIKKFEFVTVTQDDEESQNLNDVLSIGNVSSIGMDVGIITATSFVKSGGTSDQFLKADGSIDTSTYASQSYVGLATAGLASVSYVNSKVGLATAGLASQSYVGLATAGLASQSYVGLATAGLASVSYVNSKVGLATAGLASQSYVGLATSGLASETYVGLATSGLASETYVGLATSGLASETYVGLATSGLLSFTGNGSALTGIVTYIEAGSGILLDQNTGKVTITNIGGGGGSIGLTIRDEGNTVGTAGSVLMLNFVGENISATASGTASTITVLTQTYVETAGVATYSNTAGIASYSDVSGIATYASTSGIATNATYASTSGIATVSQGLTGTPNITVGVVTATSYNGSGINLTGIVTYIEAGSGILLDQNTGKVTITNTGGGGGGIIGLTIRDEGSIVGTAGSVITLNFVGENVTATASGTASTITIATQTYVNTAGIATYASTAGIATYASTAGIATYASTAGIATYASTAGIATYASTSGIATVSQGLTGTPNITVGVVTATSYNGSGSNLTGIVTYIQAGAGISVSQNTGSVTITNTGASLSSNNVFTGINTFSGNNSFTGNIIIEQASEAFNKYNTSIGSGTTVTLDCSSGNIHYITSTVSGNWTANLTNVGVSSGYCANYTLVIIQSTTAYIPNALQIAGVSTSINWQGGSIPSGNNNKKDVIAYTVFNDGGVYTVLGQLVTFG